MAAPGEFEIIERYFTQSLPAQSVRVGIGDDAAIVSADGPLAIAVDMLVEGRHFPVGFAPDALGFRALAVNLSDLAAVGARPLWATLALSLPASDPAWLDAFAGGFFRLANQHGVALIGGDTTRGPLTVTVGIFGAAAATPLLRSGGRAGDRIFVSGTLGDASAALEHLATPPAQHSDEAAALCARFAWPQPRVALGQALIGVARAAIDISDGLVADLGHICRQSGVGAIVELDALPLSPALTALYPAGRAEAFALGGGDDYELCFTVPPAAADEVRRAAEALGIAVSDIGELTAAPGIRGRRDGRTEPLPAAGFTHF